MGKSRRVLLGLIFGAEPFLRNDLPSLRASAEEFSRRNFIIPLSVHVGRDAGQIEQERVDTLSIRINTGA
jgi:hypothetical protein